MPSAPCLKRQLVEQAIDAARRADWIGAAEVNEKILEMGPDSAAENRTAKAYMLAIVGAEYVLRLLPAGTHEYERFIRPSELAEWGRAADLMLMDTAGLDYDPFRDRCGLSADVSVNYLAHLVPA